MEKTVKHHKLTQNSVSFNCQSKQVWRCCINFLHELTGQILTNQSIKIGRRAWPTRDHGEKLKATVFPACNNCLNFRIRETVHPRPVWIQNFNCAAHRIASNISFPPAWKESVVIPILKEGDHEVANNNRPVSLLPALSKICERAALNQLTEYTTRQNCLTERQNGNKK